MQANRSLEKAETTAGTGKLTVFGEQPFTLALQLAAASKPQRELVAQDVVATDLVDRGLALPTLAAHFPGDGLLPLGDGLGQGRAQIKIASDTLVVGTGEAE